MSKGKIYIAGPMTGYPEYNFPAFNAAAERLRADGWGVINPVEIVDACGGAEWYEENNLIADVVRNVENKICSQVDAIYLLKGWEKSYGAKNELEYFLTRHLPFEDSRNAPVILEGSEADA